MSHFQSALCTLGLVACLAAAPVAAQVEVSDPTRGAADVRLDIQRLAVDSLSVTADSVRADFTLDASVGALLVIRAGLSVRLDHVVVTSDSVRAAADLAVRLDTVARVLLEAIEAIRENPDLVRGADARRTELPAPEAP